MFLLKKCKFLIEMSCFLYRHYHSIPRVLKRCDADVLDGDAEPAGFQIRGIILNPVARLRGSPFQGHWRRILRTCLLSFFQSVGS